MTFAMRGNSKLFGKRLSPCAEMPNLSGNDFRRARKCQTIREITFAKRGNAKPFGKLFAGGPQITLIFYLLSSNYIKIICEMSNYILRMHHQISIDK